MSEENKKLRTRKPSSFINEMVKEWRENPIVEKLEDAPHKDVTTEEHIKELQEILVQTCIDYIKKNNLTDVDAVHFSADGLGESVEYGEWTPGTDSYIKLTGIKIERHRRKNGEIFEVPYWYVIGEYM